MRLSHTSHYENHCQINNIEENKLFLEVQALRALPNPTWKHINFKNTLRWKTNLKYTSAITVLARNVLEKCTGIPSVA